MSEYLAFARRVKGNSYVLHFTRDTDSVWGNQWNVCPAGIIPDIDVDPNCLSSSLMIDFPEDLMTAGENTCFSMQDCIDGIIPVIWSEPGSKTAILCHFGDEKDKVIEELDRLSVKPYNESVYADRAEEIMGSMMDDLDNIGKGGENNDDIDNLEF